MHTISKLSLAIMLFAATAAHAFVTVIDVEEKHGQVTTIQAPGDADLAGLAGKLLTYRGRAEEAAALFTKIMERAVPAGLGNISSEINAATGTVSVTVAVQGFMGWEYSYFIIKRKSE